MMMNMVTLFLGSLMFLLSLIVIVLILAIIGIAVIFFGCLFEEGLGKEDGFFHRVFEVIDDNIMF
jgi:hypothetical protein